MQKHSTVVSDYDAILAHVPRSGRRRATHDAWGALAYARISRSLQTTLDIQFERIMRLAHTLGVPVLRPLQDTGSGMRADREGYQELLKEAQTGRYSHVLLYRADRLARDSAELQTAVKALWRLGIKVCDTHHGEITPELLPLLGFLAENELRVLSGRTDMGLEQAHNQGHKIGSIPTGYRKSATPGVPEMDPELGPLVRDLFVQAAAGADINALCALWTQRTGSAIDRKVLRRILQNPYYCGVLVNFRSRQSVLEQRYAREPKDWKATRHNAPLIDEETFLAVQERLAQHSYVGQHRVKQSSYALQGILWCARCQRRMEGNNGGAGRSAVYRCPLCKASRGLKKLEAAVRRAIHYAVLTDEDERRFRTKAFKEQRGQAQAELAAATAHIERLTLKRQKLYERLDEGIIDAEQYRAQVATLDKERAGWQERQAAYKQQLARVPAVPDKSEIDWLHWTEHLATKDVATQQRIYRHCCAAIRLDIATNTVTVRYTPQVLYLMRAEERTEPL